MYEEVSVLDSKSKGVDIIEVQTKVYILSQNFIIAPKRDKHVMKIFIIAPKLHIAHNEIS